MALHPIGSDGCLLELKTPLVSVTIKGADSLSPPLAFCEEKAAELTVLCDDEPDLALAGDAEIKTSESLLHNHFMQFRTKPVFFEQRRYEIIIEPIGAHRVEFWHENFNVRNKVTPVGQNQQLLTGVLNFGNDIGFSDLVFLVDGTRYLTVTIEVFPSKISYKEDYLAIVSDVTQEIYNLVFDFLKKTYASFDIAPTRRASPVEFFAIIQKIYDDFVRAADMILRSPHHQLQQESEILAQHKIHRTNRETVRWLEKHPDRVTRTPTGLMVDKALAVRKYVTYDTRENRLTKFMLEQTARRLEGFRKQYQKIRANCDPEILRKIHSMTEGIRRRCATGFMQEVSSEPGDFGMSLVFGMAPGYRQLYRCYLLLQRGLNVTGSIFHISVKDLAVLYEYWCFIKLNSLMRNKYQLLSQDIIRAESTGLAVSLVKGQSSRVRYLDPQTGEKITLSYNPKETKIPTVPQRPDNVLRLHKSSAKISYEYVFDAKYRVNPSAPDSDYHRFIDSTPGPEVDDINTMHRYRDAIVYRHSAPFYERTMFGAYVLFPYANESEYEHHRFFQSIDKVNIGGLPFLPSATRLVTNMLDDLIDDSPDAAFERATLPSGIEARLKKVDWNRREVLVGTVRSREQLDICLAGRFYYVPARLVQKDRLPILRIALYQPKNIFGANGSGVLYHGDVLSTERVKRSEIVEIPRDSDEPYYRFDVREWKKLDRRIETREIGIRQIAYTNDFLLKHSLQVPELFLQTEEEYRFLTELKRVVSDVSLINEQEATGFAFGAYRVIFESGSILLTDGRQIIQRCEIDRFLRHPNAEFRLFVRNMQ